MTEIEEVCTSCGCTPPPGRMKYVFNKETNKEDPYCSFCYEELFG